MKVKSNKQHDLRGATLQRIARDISKLIIVTPRNLAKVFSNEAKKVRSMR